MNVPIRIPRAILIPLTAAFLMAAAAPVAWKDYKRGTKIMQDKKRAAIVFFSGEDEFTDLAEASLFSSKPFVSKMKKAVAIRIESAKEDSKELCEKYDVVPGTGAIVILDVQGNRLERYSQDLNAEEVEEVLLKAIEDAKEKGKVLTKLEKAFETAEKGHKSKKYAVALQNYHLVLLIQEKKGEEVPSDLYEKAETAIEEIRAIALKQLEEGEKLLEEKQYAKAQKIARSVEQAFPDEQILAAVKALKEAIEQKQMDEYKGGK